LAPTARRSSRRAELTAWPRSSPAAARSSDAAAGGPGGDATRTGPGVRCGGCAGPLHELLDCCARAFPAGVTLIACAPTGGDVVAGDEGGGERQGAGERQRCAGPSCSALQRRTGRRMPQPRRSRRPA
jgi:hypothetical protein